MRNAAGSVHTLDGIGSLDLASNALCETAKLVGGGSIPGDVGVGVGVELAIIHGKASERMEDMMHLFLQVMKCGQ